MGKKLLSCMLAALLLVGAPLLSACSSTSTGSGSDVTGSTAQSETASFDPTVVTDNLSDTDENAIPSDLSQEIVFQGITIMVDPQWTPKLVQKRNLVDPEGSDWSYASELDYNWRMQLKDENAAGGLSIRVRSFLNGETKDFEALKSSNLINSDVEYNVSNEASIGDTKVFRVDTADGFHKYFAGYDEKTERGFMIELHGPEEAWTKSNCETLTKFLQSVSYDPSFTIRDSKDDWSNNYGRDTSSDSSSSSTSNSTSTQTSQPSTTTSIPTATSQVSTIDEEDAMTAVEQYGRQQYPYGFEPEWILGRLAHDHEADGSWSFKVKVKITNKYGATAETTFEADVAGTNDAPEVTYFYVYDQDL